MPSPAKLLGQLSHDSKMMPLFQDKVDGEFFLFDGDSLLMEAASTAGWQYGQQLHLFYSAESILHLLRSHGGSCQVVFFQNTGKAAWKSEPLMRLFRHAMQLHLVANCTVPVHRNFVSSTLDQSWLSFLERELPLFLILSDSIEYDNLAVLEQIHLAFSCLSRRVPIVYSSHLIQEDRKLHGLFLQWKKAHADFFIKLQKATSFIKLLEETSSKQDSNVVTDAEIPAEAEHVAVMVDTGSGLRDWLAVRAALRLLDSKQDGSAERASCWCLYFACMSVLTLEDRLELVAATRRCSRDPTGDSTQLGERLEENCMASLENFAEFLLSDLLVLNDLERFSDPASIADLVDVFVYQRFGLTWSGQLAEGHPRAKEILQRYNSYAAEVTAQLQRKKSADTDQSDILSLLPLSLSDELLPEPVVEKGHAKAKLQHIDNQLVNEFAGGLLEKLKASNSISLTTESANSAALFDERFHWHSFRELQDDLEEKAEPELSKNPWQRKKQLTNIQKFKRYIRMYGESLQNETCETVVLSIGDSASATAEKPMSAKQQKQNSQDDPQKKGLKQQKGKPKPISKADAIKEENLRAKGEKDMKKLKEQWKNLLPGFKKLDPTQAIAEATQVMESCTVQGRLFEEPALFVIQQQYRVWKASCSSKEGKSFAALADLIRTLHKYTSEPLVDLISSDFRVKIAEYFVMVGFKEAAAVSAISSDRLKSVQVEKDCLCPMSYRDFQMQHMGHLMQRNVRFDPDPRVKGFIPDTWQRELLDVVDRRESAVIVAPTSSGKTFCSYYCMKKVLEMSDEAVVVYVSPTKALVNQVQASISARFHKPNLTPGMELCGVFTRDYSQMATSCQILVTVPQCLELLLLSPRRQGWASRIRYVIFDEVHCIGTGIGGVVWEYLLCLIRCPFLALSATIANKDYFHDWLHTVRQYVQVQDGVTAQDTQRQPQQLSKKQQRQKTVVQTTSGSDGYVVNLVTYSERYSDIRTSIYLPTNESIAEVNPCSFLNDKLLWRNGFPTNLSLSPKETLAVLSAALECFHDDQDAIKALEKFNPNAYFDTQPINRMQFRELEVNLKLKLSELLRRNPQSKATELLSTIKSQEPNKTSKMFAYLGDVDIFDNFPDLIDRLRSEGRLPALVFMNDRSGIQKLAASLVDRAKARIAASIDKSLLERMEQAKEALAAAAKRNRDKEDSDGEEESQSPPELESYQRDRLQYRNKIHACAYFTPQAVSDSFLNRALEKFDENDETKSMLELGVGFHHAGCSTSHRRAVEMLFRAGHLQVVTATATLALGIHMPCKTVIFAGDDKFLDALNYHQMAGRSGRRGFDNIGNVVFYGVPSSKISHLIQADLPELKGGFPLTCAFVLRLLLLTGNSTDSEIAHAKAMTVLEHPFAAHKRPDMLQQLRLFLLFSAQYLHRLDLINEVGRPLGLAGLVCHMGYMEPGNFVLTYLLRSSALRSLCLPSAALPPVHYGVCCGGCQTGKSIVGKRFKCTQCWSDYSLCSACYGGRPNHNRGRSQHTKADFELIEPPLKLRFSDEILRQLIHILCHLFTKLQLPRSLIRKTPTGFVYKMETENSKVLLEPLPPSIEAEVLAYNTSTVDTYTNYLHCVAQCGLFSFSTKLPFSNAAPLQSANSAAGEVSAVAPLARLSWGPSGRASDVALRNVLLSPDYSNSYEQLRRLLPLEILTDASLIPLLPPGRQLNAYVLDFFKHGSLNSLRIDNGLREGDIYQLLIDFSLACRAVATILQQLATDAEDPVLCAFQHVSREFGEKFHAAFPDAKRLPQ